MTTREHTTQLLRRLSEGDEGVTDELYGAIQGELHKLAQMHMARRGVAHTLQSTALVHEAWLRLVEDTEASWPSRGHFYAMASKVMRSILVDYARKKSAEKRGGDHARVSRDVCADRLRARALAGVCHRCGICAFANRRPNGAFGRLMRWHRTWCPAWRAHTRVYGEKQLEAAR